ncbi:hypothetical protein B0H19DRAFT_1215700 [Mycena capillaripes]|nr:hypothetical protein B0H19DRAFT_1215700 [Mycena capillaripes]
MPQRTGPGFTISFGAMLASVMIALKLKESLDDCKHSYSQLSTEEEGRVTLGSDEVPPVYRDLHDAEGTSDEAISLINTDITVTRPKRKRAKCCMCCGLDCSLFWKAFGIVCDFPIFAGPVAYGSQVVAIFAVWNAFKLIRWASTPALTGLEDMPTYSTSLGCVSAPYIYAGSPTSFNVPIGTDDAGHGFDIRGGAVGTITVLEGAPTDTKVRYEVVLRSDDKALLDDIIFDHPPDQDDTVTKSHLLIVTPHPAEGACLRYDLKMFLNLAAHAIAHVQFDPDSHIQLDDFFVTLFPSKRQNMILPHNNVRAHKMMLEVFEGWIVGDVSIDSSTKLTTQRGRGVMNVRVHPTPGADPASPEVATLRTTSGSGRTDIFYVDHDAHIHRPISAVHMSSMNADMYLTYRDAQYSGLVELAAKSYTATGLQKLAPLGTEPTGEEKWTHWAGDKQGKDELLVKTRGWAGLYF